MRILLIRLIKCAIQCKYDEFLSTNNQCYKKQFQPTKEFKQIMEGQTVPKDFNTGIKKGKLLIKESNNEYALIKEIQDKSIVLKDQSKVEKTINHEKLIQHFFDYFYTINLDVPNYNQILLKLKQIEPYAHDSEVGNALISNEILKLLIEFLQPKWPLKIRSYSATLLASSMQNNGENRAIKEKINIKILKYINYKLNSEILNRFLYLLSIILRRNLIEIITFLQAEGILTLQAIFLNTKLLNIKKRCLTIISDLFEFISEKKKPQLINLSINQQVKFWCNQLFDTLIQLNHGFENFDFKEKLLNSIYYLFLFPIKCKSKLPLKDWINEERSEFLNDPEMIEYIEKLNKIEEL